MSAQTDKIWFRCNDFVIQIDAVTFRIISITYSQLKTYPYLPVPARLIRHRLPTGCYPGITVRMIFSAKIWVEQLRNGFDSLSIKYDTLMML